MSRFWATYVSRNRAATIQRTPRSCSDWRCDKENLYMKCSAKATAPPLKELRELVNEATPLPGRMGEVKTVATGEGQVGAQKIPHQSGGRKNTIVLYMQGLGFRARLIAANPNSHVRPMPRPPHGWNSTCFLARSAVNKKTDSRQAALCTQLLLLEVHPDTLQQLES